MEMVNLVDFVKSGEAFEKIEGYYNQIVSDFDFGSLEGFIKINNVLDFDKIDESKRTLFVLDKLLYKNIINFLDIKNICVLDMNFGINSLGSKISLSNTDLGEILNKNISIYEPYDLVSFLNCIMYEGKKYIRINKNSLPLNFSDNINQTDFIDLTNKGFDGEDFVLLSTGSMLPEIIRTAHLLNENGLFPSVLVLNKLDLNLSSLNFVSKNIIFVIDVLNKGFCENTIKDDLNGFNIKFIYPSYDKITTVLDEYRCQDLFFDAESLFTIIKNN